MVHGSQLTDAVKTDADPRREDERFKQQEASAQVAASCCIIKVPPVRIKRQMLGNGSFSEVRHLFIIWENAFGMKNKMILDARVNDCYDYSSRHDSQFRFMLAQSDMTEKNE